MPRKLLILFAMLVSGLGVLLPAADNPPAAVTVTTADGVAWKFVPATMPAPAPETQATSQPTSQPTTLPAQQPADPPIATRPALAALVRWTADPGAANRGEGFNLTGTAALTDLHVEGWRQNLTYMSGGGSLTLTNVRSVRAYRADSSQRYQGQGLYFGNPNEAPPASQWPGSLAVRGCIFGWNGYLTANGNLNGYRHGLYGGRFAGLMTVEDSIFIGNACAGVQVRRGGTIRRCVFINNGIGLLSVAGDVTFEDCIVLGGHRYAEVDTDGHVMSWTGDNAVSNYTHLTLKNCVFAGVPGQAANKAATPKQYDIGCIVNSRKYSPNPDWPPADGGKIVATNCVIAGWPGPTFAGDRPHDGSGFVVKAGVVAFDPMPLVNAAMANTVTVSEAVAGISAGVRGGVR